MRKASWWLAFQRDHAGAIAIQFAVLAPILFGTVAVAVDYGFLAARRTQLQNAVDSAALAAVRDLGLANQNQHSVAASVARSMVLSTVKDNGSLIIESRVISPDSIEVSVRENVTNLMGKILSYGRTEVQVKAVARVASTRLCMVALESEKEKTVSLKRSARLTGIECSIFSNSKDKGGIKVEDYAQVDAELVCSAGGVDGKHGHFARRPMTDCPAISDPLASRKPPNVGPCDFNKTEIKGGVRALIPGVYCQGLKVTEGASVSLSPGIYIIQGGKLVVEKGASFEGKDVGFYLAGKESSFEFGYDSTISLSAPKTGEMAGLLFFDDRLGKWDKHKIFSNDARVLLGTIYLPNGSLYIDSQKPIADKSAYTVLVTRTLELSDGPNLVLNSNYDATSVPVPPGVGPLGSRVSLTK